MEEIVTHKEEPEKKVTVELVKHREYVEMLRNPRLTLKFLVTVTLIMLCFFFGLTLLVVSVKRFFPYHSIETNAYGATIMEEEDKTMSYWLFNTAVLWGSSGIQVKKNDVLTIRASGSMHTAIHHLVDDARFNTSLRDPWMDTKGGRDYKKDWAPLRAKYRIAQAVDENVLLMRVRDPEDSRLQQVDRTTSDWKRKELDRRIGEEEEDRNNMYVIGRERENLTIHKDGVLEFAVNDVVLSPRIVVSMYREESDSLIKIILDRKLTLERCSDHKKVTCEMIKKEWVEFRNKFIIEENALKQDYSGDLLAEQYKKLTTDFKDLYLFTQAFNYARILNESKNTDQVAQDFFNKTVKVSIGKKNDPTKSDLENWQSLVKMMEHHGLSMGRAYNYDDCYPVVNEYNYYLENNLEDVWFADNVGSFLIVVEQNRPQ